MNGLPDHNYPAFFAVAETLRQQGYAVLNPAANFAGETDLPKTVFMRHDFFHVLQADILAVLDGWEESSGAKAEILVAQEIGTPVFKFNEQTSKFSTRCLPTLQVVKVAN